MAIEVNWYNEEKTIILEAYSKDWTWEEFYELRNTVPPMMSEVQRTVHVIADFGENLAIPRGNAMIHARNVLESFPDNWGMLIMITNSAMINAFSNLFLKVFPALGQNKIHLVKSIDEALELIREYEPEIM